MIPPKEQVTRLEGLLERVRRNAAKPRMRAAAATPAAPPVAAPAPTPAVAKPAPHMPAEPPTTRRVPEPPAEPIVLSSPPVEETTLVRAIASSADDEQHIVDVEELLEDEIVDITDVAEEATSGVMEYAEEEPPASSRRPIAANMSEALAEAAESVELDEGREIPLKTPPPESGPQAAPPFGLAAPPVPDIDELADADIVSRPQPTTEQLGATIELEPAERMEFELAEPAPARKPAAARPAPAPPPEPVRPEVVQRPALAGSAGAFVSAAKSFKPETFVELLDASLSLK